MKMVFGRGSWQ